MNVFIYLLVNVAPENKNKIKLNLPFVAAIVEVKTEPVSGYQQCVFDVFRDVAGFYAAVISRNEREIFQTKPVGKKLLVIFATVVCKFRAER